MNVAGLTRMRWLLGTLLIVAAALFAIGVATEGDVHQESVATVEEGEHNEATEAGEHDEASESGEELLGINLESSPLVVLAVIVSVALAAATWRSDRKLILLITALFAAAFAVLDVANSRTRSRSRPPRSPSSPRSSLCCTPQPRSSRSSGALRCRDRTQRRRPPTRRRGHEWQQPRGTR